MLKHKRMKPKGLYDKFKVKMIEISTDLCNVFWKHPKVILKQIVFCSLQKMLIYYHLLMNFHEPGIPY